MFENNLGPIRKSKVTSAVNKPAYVGISILDLDKLLINSPCNYTKNKYGNNSRLLFTETDSLMYEIKTENVSDDFSKDKEMFDFSNYLAKVSVLWWFKQISGW